MCSSDLTYAVRLEQIGDQLSLAIDNQSVLGMHDWSHDERSRGAVGFKLAPGAITPVESHFLDPQLNNVDTLLLPVDRLLQTNFNWRYFEYDSASQWSTDPSIGRWGCALTSLTMVMNYHQLEMMPDGKEVNPRYVNDWLKSQPDGYVGEGLLNWWAATRLIKEISDQYSTAEKQLPKLEFSRQAVDWQNAARSALTAGNPLIAQVPGHFVVVNGFEHSTDSFFIQDPFYD